MRAAAPTAAAVQPGGPARRMRPIASSRRAGAATGPGHAASAQAGPGPDTIKMVERAVFLHHPYENRDRLRRALLGEIGAEFLDRALERLERSGKIVVDGEAIRWAPGAGCASGEECDEVASKSILAGTCFEWLEKNKLPTETIGEYIVRVTNAHEPGSYTAKDAREFDEDMRRAAKGEYYTHEEVWKEFGLDIQRKISCPGRQGNQACQLGNAQAEQAAHRRAAREPVLGNAHGWQRILRKQGGLEGLTAQDHIRHRQRRAEDHFS